MAECALFTVLLTNQGFPHYYAAASLHGMLTPMLLKTVHVTCAALSLGGFALRGFWMLRDSPLLHARLTRILPHINDTVLLGSALWLAFRIEQYPFVHGWLTAKVLALLAYIVLGTVALKRGKTKNVRVAAFVLALATFLYIVAVALTHHPLPGF